jgi:hypothetical protein
VRPTLWGYRRGIKAVARYQDGFIVSGRDWHAFVRVVP